jgi:quercetin dioxygenase-like cupin family protein
MQTAGKIFGALLALSIAGLASAAAQTAGTGGSEAAPAVVVPEVRFDGNVAFNLSPARRATLHVVMRKWQIHGKQHIAKFPEEGFVVVHLHSGKIVTTINGQETARKPEDYWVIPQGQTMSLRVTSESALLETTAVRPAR